MRVEAADEAAPRHPCEARTVKLLIARGLLSGLRAAEGSSVGRRLAVHVGRVVCEMLVSIRLIRLSMRRMGDYLRQAIKAVIRGSRVTVSGRIVAGRATREVPQADIQVSSPDEHVRIPRRAEIKEKPLVWIRESSTQADDVYPQTRTSQQVRYLNLKLRHLLGVET